MSNQAGKPSTIMAGPSAEVAVNCDVKVQVRGKIFQGWEKNRLSSLAQKRV
jgi:hypothetical protein